MDPPEAAMSVPDIKKICRLCMSDKDLEELVADLVARIYDCVSIKVSTDQSELPKSVCRECLSHVDAWHNFREKCHKTQVSIGALKPGANSERAVEANDTADAKAALQLSLGLKSEPLKDPVGDEGLKNHVGETLEVVPMETSEQPFAEGSSEPDFTLQEIDTEDVKPILLQQTLEVVGSAKGTIQESVKCKKEVPSENRPSSPPDTPTVTLADSTKPKPGVIDLCEDESAGSNEKTHSEAEKCISSTIPDNGSDVVCLDDESSNSSARPDVPAPSSDSGVNLDAEPAVIQKVSTYASHDDISKEGTEGRQEDSLDGNGVKLVHDGNRTTPDSTMAYTAEAASDCEDPESLNIVIKEEPTDDDYEEYIDMPVQVSIKQESGDEADVSAPLEAEPVHSDEQVIDYKTLTCHCCQQTFGSLHSLVRHIKTKTHVMTKMYSKRLDSLNAQQQHSRNQFLAQSRIPNNVYRKQFSCKICRRPFRSKAELVRHEGSLKHKKAMADAFYSRHNRQEITMTPILREQLSRAPPPDQEKYIQIQKNPPLVRPSPQPRPPSLSDKEFLCPIPNCNYICHEGNQLLVHMTSHGIDQNVNSVVSQQQPMHQINQSQLRNFGQHQVFFPQSEKPPVRKRAITTYENLHCPYHGATFYNARGYLNHVRTCNQAPPIDTFKVTIWEDRPVEAEGEPSNSDQKHVCKPCKMVFSGPEGYMTHMKNQHQRPLVMLNKVNQPQTVVQKPPTFVAPAKNHRKIACKVCGKTFNFAYSLRVHMKCHPSLSTCKFCKKSFGSIKSCMIHLKTHFLPPGSPKLFCTQCYQGFDTRSEIATHKFRGLCVNSMKMKIYSCDKCDHSFKGQDDLEKHKNEEHCGEEDDVKVPVEQEEDDESPPEPTPEETEPEKLEIRSTHPGAQTYCSECQRDFSSHQNLKRHCRFQHNMSDRATDMMIQRYLKSYSTNNLTPDPRREKPFKCEYCGSSFNLERVLNLHLNNYCRNSPHRPRCGSCDKPITKNGCETCQIALHPDDEMMQTDIKPNFPSTSRKPNCVPTVSSAFKCPIGNMTFDDEATMLQHYASCGGGCEQFIKCSVCRAQFRFQKHFNQHNCYRNQQKRNKRFECTECHRTFSKNIYVTSHMAKCPALFPDLEPSPPKKPPPPKLPVETAANDENRSLPTPMKRTRASGPIEGSGSQGEDSPKEAYPFRCPHCPKAYNMERSLKFHVRIHDPENTEESYDYYCNFCRKGLLRPQLYTHTYKCLKSLFCTEESVECDKCKQVFYQTEGREIVIKIHSHVKTCYPNIPFLDSSVTSTAKFICFQCIYAFPTLETLNAHKSDHAKKRKRHWSEKYGRSIRKKPKPSRPSSSASSSQIVEISDPSEETAEDETFNELELNETTNSMFQCSVCHRDFDDIDKLKNHEKVHGIVRGILLEDELVE